ncbi:hypothetical protein AZ019_005084, partial [Klebsiella pneumoniae]
LCRIIFYDDTREIFVKLAASDSLF